ncbi:MAG TPA: hypothetical protein VJY54_14055 [Lachnospiraceae bacterium]|nr:hypothetical protein [Lachnospiraceae bacterium]
MKRKYLPLIIMLMAGAVTSMITFIMKYSIVKKLMSLLVVLVIFYILGSVLKCALDTFEKQNVKAALDEGEVIEKENKTVSEEEPETKKAEVQPKA